MHEKLLALLGEDVTAEVMTGVTFRGMLVGYCDEPAVLIQDSNGFRTMVAVSAIRKVNGAYVRELNG